VYLTMERLRGRGVMNTVRRAGAPGHPKRVRRARSILRGVLVALDDLHQRSVLHGDLKTRNLYVAPSGAIRLLDLGAARHIDPHTGLADGSRFMGTPRYAPPEQRDCQPLDVRADLFSAAALTVRLLTDEKPEWPPSPPAALPADFYGPLSRMLAMDRAYRPDSARSALALLGAADAKMRPARWRGSAVTTVIADRDRRATWGRRLKDLSGNGTIIHTRGRRLLAAMEPLWTQGDETIVLIEDLHEADEDGWRGLNQLIRRSMRKGWTLHLRATAAPHPEMRELIELMDFQADPPPEISARTLRQLRSDGRWLEALRHARGADPLLPGDRGRVREAAACWLTIGQRGEAARLLAALAPLKTPEERQLAARLALEQRAPQQALTLLDGDGAPLARAIGCMARYQLGAPDASFGLPTVTSSITPGDADLIRCWRATIFNQPCMPKTLEGQIEQRVQQGDAAALLDWLEVRALGDRPEIRGGLIARAYSSSASASAPMGANQ
ncbi:MAG: hypothetical protein AAFV53_28710, partial [Myxococcota bacterium]